MPSRAGFFPIIESEIQAHAEDQAVFARDVESVDHFAVVEAEDGFARRIEHLDRLEREAVQMEGVMRARLIRDCEFEKITCASEAAGGDVRDRSVVEPAGVEAAGDVVDRR
jgi:hypothetical protein